MSNAIRKQPTFKQNVYKSVIESPFIIKWPRISSELSSRLRDCLVLVIQPVGAYRKLERISGKALKKNEKTAVDKVDCHQPRIMAEHRILVGINEVTKHMEQMIQSHHNEIKVPENMLSNKILTPAIFICRRDIKPIHLCLHLLTLAALANVKLIPLPADSEAAIAQALNLKRVSALFLEICDSDLEERLRLAVNEAPSVEAPWLTKNLNHKRSYIDTRIKILKTVGTFNKKL